MKSKYIRSHFDGKEVGLKPCPFCGNVPDLVVALNMAFVECMNCGAVISFQGNEAKERTIKQYNKRCEK